MKNRSFKKNEKSGNLLLTPSSIFHWLFTKFSQKFHIISTMIHIYASTDRSVYNSRSVDLYEIDLCRSSEMDQVDQCMLCVFLFCIMIRIDRSVRLCNFGSIDPAWSNSLFIIFKIYNFKGIITILKIISLMGHKAYKISLNGHSYRFFALKKQFSLHIIIGKIVFFRAKKW